MPKPPPLKKKRTKKAPPKKVELIPLDDYSVVMLRGLTDEELAELASVKR